MRPPIVAGPISRNFRLEIAEPKVAAGFGVAAGAGVGVAAAAGDFGLSLDAAGFACAETNVTVDNSSNKPERPALLSARSLFIYQILDKTIGVNKKIQLQLLLIRIEINVRQLRALRNRQLNQIAKFTKIYIERPVHCVGTRAPLPACEHRSQMTPGFIQR